jgi:hypothetical protein
MEASERQAKLAQKLAEFRQRSQVKEAHQLLIKLGIPLDLCQIFLPNTAEADYLEQWLSQSFPWQSGQIDWHRISGSVCVSWHEQPASMFHELCQTQQLCNSLVNVVWFSADQPILAMPLDVVKLSLEAIVAEDWDTWIFDVVGGWCVEFYHEGTMCFGRI